MRLLRGREGDTNAHSQKGDAESNSQKGDTESHSQYLASMRALVKKNVDDANMKVAREAYRYFVAEQLLEIAAVEELKDPESQTETTVEEIELITDLGEEHLLIELLRVPAYSV